MALINRGKSNEDIEKMYLARLKAIKEAEKQKSKPKTKQETIITPVTNIQNPQNYLILEGRTHKNYFYPDLLVSMEKYHHNENWNTCQEVLHKGNAFMLTIRQFVDFIKLLKTGKAFNGKGKQADKATLDKILDEMFNGGSEWLDAKYNGPINQLKITYHKIKNGNIKEITEPLEDCLMKACNHIDINSANSQGLPTKESSNSRINYSAPHLSNVSWFGSLKKKEKCKLGCYMGPEFRDPYMGVRIARIK